MSHVHVLRIGRLTGKGIILAAAKHNLREIQAERGAGSNIDPLRTKLNYVLQGHATAANVAASAQALMDSAKVNPLRKDAVRGLEIIFSLSPLSAIEHGKFFPDCVAWTERYFQVPILSATVHLDESAPHCHVLLLPLVDGRMIGSSLFGNRAKLQALQADFHALVGQGYGLARQATQKRHSAAARREAADMIVAAMKEKPSWLDNRTFVEAMRAAFAQNPEPLIQCLGMNMPRKQSKYKTFASIIAKPCKSEKPIGFHRMKPIGFNDGSGDEKKQNLSCVGLAESTHLVSPADELHPNDIQEEYFRERDSELNAGYWDELRGEFIKPPTKTKPKSSEIDRVRTAIQVVRSGKK